ncbi:MAG TPA: hypothetical protein VJL81_06365 [Solirubrobacterales bacterium]|nr:hypothetical protein [Solirubrobacterales bacterium]
MAEKTATGAEAAAIAAAIARFESEFAAAPAAGPKDAMAPWQRAALLEGVGAKQDIQDPQARGGARWQS